MKENIYTLKKTGIKQTNKKDRFEKYVHTNRSSGERLKRETITKIKRKERVNGGNRNVI